MMTMYGFIDVDEFRNAVLDENNYLEILNLIGCFKRFYKAENNIDRYAYNRKYWMIEAGWSMKELTAIRDRKASDCMRCLFKLNQNRHFLPFVAKEDYLDCLNEVYNFLVMESNPLSSAVVA